MSGPVELQRAGSTWLALFQDVAAELRVLARVVVLAATSNQVTGDIAAGVALLVAGGLLITGGLV